MCLQNRFQLCRHWDSVSSGEKFNYRKSAFQQHTKADWNAKLHITKKLSVVFHLLNVWFFLVCLQILFLIMHQFSTWVVWRKGWDCTIIVQVSGHESSFSLLLFVSKFSSEKIEITILSMDIQLIILHMTVTFLQTIYIQ